MFVDLYENLFGADEALEAFKLLQGIANVTLLSGRALWDLAQIATAETVRSVIRTRPTNEVKSALADTDDGTAFLSSLDRYIEAWGTRSNMVEEYGEPSWTENPATIIENLKNYLEDDAVDPRVHWVELVAERESLTEDVRVRLATYPEPVRQQFEELLISGQQGQRIQEDHNWWIDQRGTHAVRQVVLEIGRRIAAARVIEDSNDVFYLDGDEIRATMRTLSAGQVSGDHKVVANERRADMDRWKNVKPPQALGTDPGPPPENATSRAIRRFFGGPPPAQDQERPDVLKGIPGSPGKTSGVARVILHLGDAGRLERGDILVTATTNPPWTPLFATAGGIVTDTGGPLSHCAIVAREYGLPAVVGTGTGTDFIKDGQMIEVDGNKGEIRVLQA